MPSCNCLHCFADKVETIGDAVSDKGGLQARIHAVSGFDCNPTAQMRQQPALTAVSCPCLLQYMVAAGHDEVRVTFDGSVRKDIIGQNGGDVHVCFSTHVLPC